MSTLILGYLVLPLKNCLAPLEESPRPGAPVPPVPPVPGVRVRRWKCCARTCPPAGAQATADHSRHEAARAGKPTDHPHPSPTIVIPSSLTIQVLLPSLQALKVEEQEKSKTVIEVSRVDGAQEAHPTIFPNFPPVTSTTSTSTKVT